MYYSRLYSSLDIDLKKSYYQSIVCIQTIFVKIYDLQIEYKLDNKQYLVGNRPLLKTILKSLLLGLP